MENITQIEFRGFEDEHMEKNIKRKKDTIEETTKRRNISTTNNNQIVNMITNEGEHEIHEKDNTEEKNKYNSTDKGPFIIFLEKENISMIKTGRDLNIIKIKHIKNISKINKNKIKIELHKYEEANRILDNMFLQQARKIKTYIPKFCTETKIIIHDIPSDIDIDDYKNNLYCKHKIIEVQKMQRWNNNEKKLEDMNKLLVTVRANTLPDEMKIWDINLNYDYFIPKPMFCKNCLNYGHTKNHCKGKTRCPNCSDTEHNGECIIKIKCMHCKNNHKTGFFKCPERKKQFDIKKIMTKQKITYYQAKQQWENNNQNYIKDNYTSNKNPTTYAEVLNEEYNIEDMNTVKEENKKNKNLIDKIKQIISNVNNQDNSANDLLLIEIISILNNN